MEPDFNLGFAKESQSNIEDKISDLILKRYQYSNKPSLREWMKWNGAYIYAYGCSLAGIICAILSPLSDM